MMTELQNRKPTGSPAQLSQRCFRIYLLASLAWIVLSDGILRLFDLPGNWDTAVDIGKGIAFVFALGLILRRVAFNGLNEIEQARQSWMDANFELVRRLANVAEHRDDLTGQHGQRISRYASVLAKELGYNDSTCRLLGAAASLHDLGKVGVRDAVLMKPGILTEAERREVERHVLVGAELLANGTHPLVRLAHSVALTHHENWDGSGYPAGLVGRQIPVEGRIVAICDVFDALISERSYKAAWPLERAVEEIRRASGTKFDPAIVAAFTRCVDEFAKIAVTTVSSYSVGGVPPVPEGVLPPLPIDEARGEIGDRVYRDDRRPAGSEGIFASLRL